MKSKVRNVSSIVNGFQTVLRRFLSLNEEVPNLTTPKGFALMRFLKKLEVPDVSKSAERAQQCWLDWLNRDFDLLNVRLCDEAILRTRLELSSVFIHNSLKLEVSDEIFSNGSTYVPTKGLNSLEEKLTSLQWTVTKECRPLFLKLIFSHRALKTALKRKLIRYYGSRERYVIVSKEIYRKLPINLNKRKIGERVLTELSSNVIEIVLGSRFGTVPKNNQKDRPINLEPFGNILVQRQVGLSLRSIIKSHYGVDLKTAQSEHALLISGNVATIDLKDASDSISLRLVHNVFPKRVVDVLLACRSQYVEHKSGDIHKTYKISSMGNGFTFELMTLLLLAALRTLDHSARVYGDDIIVKDDFYTVALERILGLGFIVNHEKTFHGAHDFRESCGANYFRSSGYVLSFDAHWPNDIVDCIILFNKVVLLNHRHGILRELREWFSGLVPDVLRPRRLDLDVEPLDSLELDSYFFIRAKRVNSRHNFSRLCYDTSHTFTTYRKQSISVNLPSRSLTSAQYGKYFMYLYAGRVVPNTKYGATRVNATTLTQLGNNVWAVETKRLL